MRVELVMLQIFQISATLSGKGGRWPIQASEKTQCRAVRYRGMALWSGRTGSVDTIPMVNNLFQYNSICVADAIAGSGVLCLDCCRYGCLKGREAMLSWRMSLRDRFECGMKQLDGCGSIW